MRETRRHTGRESMTRGRRCVSRRREGLTVGRRPWPVKRRQAHRARWKTQERAWLGRDPHGVRAWPTWEVVSSALQHAAKSSRHDVAILKQICLEMFIPFPRHQPSGAAGDGCPDPYHTYPGGPALSVRCSQPEPKGRESGGTTGRSNCTCIEITDFPGPRGRKPALRVHREVGAGVRGCGAGGPALAGSSEEGQRGGSRPVGSWAAVAVQRTTHSIASGGLAGLFSCIEVYGVLRRRYDALAPCCRRCTHCRPFR